MPIPYLKRFSSREKVLGALALLSVFFLLVGMWPANPVYAGYTSKIETINRLTNKKTELENIKEENKALEIKIGRAKSESNNVRRKIGDAKARLQKKERLNDIVAMLNDVQDESGTKLAELTIETQRVSKVVRLDDVQEKFAATAFTARQSDFKKAPAKASSVEYDLNIIRIRLKSTYKPLTIFISRLFKSSFAITVNKLAIVSDSADGASHLTADIEMEVYTL